MTRMAYASGLQVEVTDVAPITKVASSTTSGPILAANDNRVYGLIFNDSTSILYLSWGNVTVSAADHSFQVPPKGFYEIQGAGSRPRWVGQISGVWASANGFARVTEAI